MQQYFLEETIVRMQQKLLDKPGFVATASVSAMQGSGRFHPIRVILTGAHEGPELDLIVPAIDRSVGLAGLAPVIGCRERAASLK